MIKERVKVVDDMPQKPTRGSAGIKTQVAGAPTTVSGVAQATGGIGRGKFIETDAK